LQEAGTRTRFVTATAQETSTGVLLMLSFEHRERHSIINRIFAVYPGSPTVEVWTRIDQPAGTAPVTVSEMGGWQLSMPATHLRWINGLRGATSDNLVDATFAIDGVDLEDGASVEIGADRRSSETHEPFIFADGSESAFYGGVIWSGSWRIF